MLITFILITVKILNNCMGEILNNYQIQVTTLTMGIVSLVYNLELNSKIKKIILNAILYIFVILMLFCLGEKLLNTYGTYLEIIVYLLAFIKYKNKKQNNNIQ